MTANADTVTVERHDPRAVFELLADETRVEILQVLGEAPEEELAFSTLRERVGTADSGQFNYHLKRLTDSFVRKTEGGYELTHAGGKIVGAIQAGRYTADATVDPVSIGFKCPHCETDLQAAYDTETARIFCECENEVSFFFPAGSLDQVPRDRLPDAFYRWNHHKIQGILAGFCPTCDGRMEGDLVLDGDGRVTHLSDDSDHETAHFEFDCQRCGHTSRALATSPAMLHPATGGLLAEHGFDVRMDPIWWIRDALEPPQVELTDSDPPRLDVTLTFEEDSIRLRIADDASVVEFERTE